MAVPKPWRRAHLARVNGPRAVLLMTLWGPLGTPTQPTMPSHIFTWGTRPSGAKVDVRDWSESALLRFWHVGHKVGGTLTPDAHAKPEVTYATAVLH